jgi:glycosyltransferase involved in cell wall biosynthesis
MEELIVLAEKRQVALIHAHSPLTINASLEAAKKLSIPLIITLHGLIDWVVRFPNALTYARHIIAAGPETARSAGPTFQKKISIIYNGINLERFHPANCSGSDSGPLRVLYYGRTKGTDARGLITLDKAIGLMRKQGHIVDARMVGRAAGVFAGNFHRYGWLDAPLPALQWSQVVFGRGRSLREAMACGNVGFPLGEGYGGLLTRERMQYDRPSLSCTLKLGANVADAETIAADLIRLDKDRRLLQDLKKEAYNIAIEHFDAYKMAQETMNIYRKE